MSNAYPDTITHAHNPRPPRQLTPTEDWDVHRHRKQRPTQAQAAADAADDDNDEMFPAAQFPFLGAFTLAPPSPTPTDRSVDVAATVTIKIPAVTLKSPHPNILAEPTLRALGFNSILTDTDSSLICPNGTRLPLRRDALNRPYLTAQLIYSPESPPVLGLGFDAGSGPPIDLLLDTCGGITALDLAGNPPAHVRMPDMAGAV
jgi:hypothetical protein